MTAVHRETTHHLPSHLFDGETGDDVDHLGVLVDVVRSHPTHQVSPVQAVQW